MKLIAILILTLLPASAQNLNVMTYGADNTGASDNATAFGNAAAAANSYVQGQVNTQPVTPATVYFPYGIYQYSGGLSFTQPVTLLCEPGAVLNYTGAAHAVDFAATLSVQSGEYTVNGCHFTGGASMTEGLDFGQNVVSIRVHNCGFLNFGNSGAWAIYLSGNNWDNDISGNTWWVNDNVPRNWLKVNATNTDSQLRFHDNDSGNLPTPTAGTLATNAGIGVWSDGVGSQIAHNNFNGFNPSIHLGPNSRATKVRDNYFEPAQTSGATIIQYDGADGLIVDGAYINMHSLSGAVPIAPTGSSAAISNAMVSNLHIVNYPGSNPIIAENNVAGQAGNEYFGITSYADFGSTPGASPISGAGAAWTTWTGQAGGGGGNPLGPQYSEHLCTSVNTSGSGVSQLSCPATVTAGTSAVGLCSLYTNDGGTIVFSPSDALGNSCVTDATYYSTAEGGRISAFRCPITTGGSDTFKCNPSAAAGYGTIDVHAATGINAFDVENPSQSSTGGSGNQTLSDSVTTTADNGLMFLFAQTGSNDGGCSASNATNILQRSDIGSYGAYRKLGTAGAYSITANNCSGPQGILAVSYK